MDNLKNFLLNHSNEKNPWSLTEKKTLELSSLVEEFLFKVIPQIEDIVINSAKTITYMVKEGKIPREFILIEFTNYILGSIFKQKPELYQEIKDSVSGKILDRTNYNIRTINSALGKKYFSNHRVEYDFITDKSIRDKAS